jgi:signal transduction histidine kinase
MHVCVPTLTHEQATIAPTRFVREGLERGEHCMWLASDATVAETRESLRTAGAVVDAALETGALSIVGCEDSYLLHKPFNPDHMIAWIRQRRATALAAGYTGMRLVGFTSCVWEHEPQLVPHLEYEAKLEELIAREPMSAMCIYDRTRQPATLIREMLSIHPHVMLGDTLCSSPHHVPAEVFLAADRPAKELSWLLDGLLAAQLRANAGFDEKAGRRELIGAQEAERRYLARELHDDLGQILYAIELSLRHEPLDVTELEALLGDAIETTRNVARDLRPAALDDLGLSAALQWLARLQFQRTGLDFELDVGQLDDTRLSPDLAIAGFRLAQEGIMNVVRHANAGRVSITGATRGGHLELLIRDDGSGFDLAAKTRGLGLLGMQERAALAGGELEIESIRGKGTAIRVRLPLVDTR